MSLGKYATTPAERETIAAMGEVGESVSDIAAKLGISENAVSIRLCRLRQKAARAGYAPEADMTHEAAQGFAVTKVSTFYDADGNISRQWVQQRPEDVERIERLRMAAQEIAAPLKGCIKPVRAPGGDSEEDLMCVYAIGDHHLGMYAWAEETGADYDCDIAEKILHRAFQRVAQAAPRATKGVVLSVGDFFHADNHTSRTPQSGHVLDTDSRHSRVIATGIRMLKRAVRFALKRHDTVEVVVIGGNHDFESSLWLAYLLAEAFAIDPRVTVRTDPRVYKYLRWGDCLIGMTHGDRCKPEKLGQIMAVDQREAWGETRHSHWYFGHVHHTQLKHDLGFSWESLSVLCPGDSWSVGRGYRSKRGMKLDIWHRRQGCILSVPATVEYINDA